MSKYEPLWIYISKKDYQNLKLSFDEVFEILSFNLDHSFLNYKKELEDYGWKFVKTSLKEKYVLFERIK